MNTLTGFRPLFDYSDWANGIVLDAAAGVPEDDLDRPLEIGPGTGTLRRILTHTWAGEATWLRRWRGETEAKWPSESETPPVSPAELRSRLATVRAEREAFLAGLDEETLGREQVYRDSRGSHFKATLSDMLLQGIVHSIHHRAQAANALRRLGHPCADLDYMGHVRRGCDRHSTRRV